jgi:hypothetical protein
MKSLVFKLILAALPVFIVVACDVGSGGFAGIGGSGYISTGSVNGFGSVFVNGVEFETDSTIFEVEDASGSQQDLRIGMVVQVKGSINADGVTGVATAIRYGDQLEGPIEGSLSSGLIDENADGTEKYFRVLGTNVVVDAANTVFDSTGFASLALNNLVEISGYFDQNQVLHATYLRLKAASFDAGATVEIEGNISALSATTFTIRNLTVNAGSANVSGLPNGLQNGVYVEVKGTYNAAMGVITAREVESEEIQYKEDGSEVSIEGYVTRYNSDSDFDINGFPVNASSAQFEPANLRLAVGLKVEAEGYVNNGVLIAEEVESRGGDVKVYARVGTVTSATSFTMNLAGGTVNVVTTSATTFEDDVLELEPFGVSQLASNDFVEVVGYETAADTVTANRVKRRTAGKTVLKANATAASGVGGGSGTITLLGVAYSFTASTEFEDENDANLDNSQIDALLASINASPVLIKIEDENSDGVAEEIDRED